MSDEKMREQILRAAVAAMPATNPLVADDLIQGHTMHTEAEDIIAVWQEATRQAMERAIALIQNELDHAATNDTRLPPAFGKAHGDPAVRASHIEAALDAIRAAAAIGKAEGEGEGGKDVSTPDRS